MTSLQQLEQDINQGYLQIAFNANLGIQVLVDGDGLDYAFTIINKEGQIVCSGEMGFDSGPYYSAEDIAAQGSFLPPHMLI